MPKVSLIKKCIRGIATPFFTLRRKTTPQVEEIRVKVENLPQGLNGCRLAIVADLHIPDTLVDTAELLSILQNSQLDGILLAGDLTNKYNHFPTEKIAAFLHDLAAIAPTFAIAGNHETVQDRLPIYHTLVEQAGIIFLSDTSATLEHKGDSLYIYGTEKKRAPLPKAPPFPTILLFHYPEHAAKAVENGFICAACGHAHGGQVRFGKRGLFSPGQGFFPRYISGRYDFHEFPVIVSRGLGDSSLPIRINNRPHLPIIVLQ